MNFKEYIRYLILCLIKVRLNLRTVVLLLMIISILEDIQSIGDMIWLMIFLIGYWYFSVIDIRKAKEEVKKDE